MDFLRVISDMPHQSHAICFDHRNDITCKTETVKLLILYFVTVLRYYMQVKSKSETSSVYEYMDPKD